MRISKQDYYSLAQTISKDIGRQLHQIRLSQNKTIGQFGKEYKLPPHFSKTSSTATATICVPLLKQ